METHQKEALGIDVGGVIIDRANDGTDTAFHGPNYLRTTAVPGAFDAIGRLVRERFAERAYIVSFCGKETERKTREWLEFGRFYELTGMLRENVFFCRKRSAKVDVCRARGITHFVDDHLDVLRHMIGVVPYLYFFRPGAEELRRFPALLPLVHRVQEWMDVEHRIGRHTL